MIVAIIDILKGTTAVTDLVASTNIYPIQAKQTASTPFIVVELSGVRLNDTKDKSSLVDYDMVSVTAFAEDPKSVYDISDAARTALDNFVGTQTGYEISNIRLDTWNASLYDADEVYVMSAIYEVHVQRQGSGPQYPPGAEIGPVSVSNSDDSFTDSYPAGSTQELADITIKKSDASTLATHPGMKDYTVADSTVTNSDATYSANVKATESLVLPDISLTEVTGSVTSHPSAKNLTCAWASIAIKNSEATTLDTIATYPVSREVELSDVTHVDSDGSGVVYPSGKIFTCTPAASASGTHYQHIYPTQRTSYVTGDTGWHVQNGTYDYTPPAYPSIQACIDPNAQQSGVRGTPASGTSSTDSVFPTMMAMNTVDGSKYRFVDDQGNPSDATVGSNIWAHVDWVNHSWTGCTNAGLVYDHLFGIWIDTDYLTDGALYTQDTTNGQSWSAWISHINGMTHKGSSDWIPVNGDMFGYSAFGAKARLTSWADNFFNGNRTDNRFVLLTGDTTADSTTNAIYFGDYGTSAKMVHRLVKTAGTAFYQQITNVFVFRIDRR